MPVFTPTILLNPTEPNHIYRVTAQRAPRVPCLDIFHCFSSCSDRTHVVLRCCRYGKPAVLDMMDVDMFETAAMKFDEVQKGLMALLMSKDLLKDNK